ncbi:MAG: NAD(P)-binding protein [Halobacteriales archaeon]|nr:NAD(P)-binding protein [Halobacteriales archaeon]
MKDHVVVLGYGYLTRPVLDKLGKRVDYVVVATDTELAERLLSRGYKVIEAESVNENVLEEADIDTARAVVVASESDADDALAVLTARDKNPDIEIIAVASNSENAEKLRRAGADTVISPAEIVGKLLVESALTGEDTSEIVEKIHRRVVKD